MLGFGFRPKRPMLVAFCAHLLPDSFEPFFQRVAKIVVDASKQKHPQPTCHNVPTQSKVDIVHEVSG